MKISNILDHVDSAQIALRCFHTVAELKRYVETDIPVQEETA